MAERVQEFSSGIIAAVVAAIVGAGTWLVREVLTSKTQIALLMAEINRRAEQRQEDREAIKADIDEVKKSVKRIEDVLIKGGDE